MRFFVLLSLALVSLWGCSAVLGKDSHDLFYQSGREIFLHSSTVQTRSASGVEKDSDDVASRIVSRFPSTTAHQWLVQLQGPIQAEHKAYVEDFIGTKLGAYIPHNTFLLYAPRSVAQKAAEASGVHWVGHFQPEHKYPTLSTFSTRSSMVIQTVPGESILEDSRTVQLLKEELQDIALVQDITGDFAKVVVLKGSAEDVALLLSRRPEIHWIEPTLEFQAHNQYAKEIVQTKNEGNAFTDQGLNGTGKIIGLADSGIDFNSCYLTNGAAPTATLDNGARKIVRYVSTYGDLVDADGHGTSVAGTLAGLSNVPGASANWNGIASGARIHFTDISTAANTLTPPDNLTPILSTARDDGAKIFVASFGATATWYSAHAAQIDSFTNQNSDFLVVVSAGNAGTEGSLSSLATSKNALVVGASQSSLAGIGGTPSAGVSGPDALASFSSRGPTPDGRIKPDIVAPGQQIVSAQAGEACATEAREGTSYSAGVAGATAAIAHQYFTDAYYPQGIAGTGLEYQAPTSYLLKAVLINSGQPLRTFDSNGNGNFISLTNEFPSSYQGFGRVQLDQSLLLDDVTDFGSTSIFARATDQVGTNEGFRQCFSVDPDVPTPQLKATLVWNDPAGTPASGHILVNNLDLVVIDNAGNEWRSDTAPNGQLDQFNNVEQVTIRGPAPGLYAVYVHGFNVPSGPQRYALVVSGNATFVSSCTGFDSSGSRVCPNQCSGAGTCGGANGLCTCDPGRLGIDCSVSACPTNCMPNGVCDFETGTCKCAPNFSGTSCEIPVNTTPIPEDPTGEDAATVNEGIPVGTFVGVVVGAFVIGAICSVILGAFAAVKFLEYKRDNATKGADDEEMN